MDDFNFYLKFAKPLVLNLPDAKDRIIAALWVKKLRDMQSDSPEANMRIEYLKLLLYVMQRNRLAGIFEKAPPEGPLQGFPPNYKATDMLALVKPGKTAPPAYPQVFTSVGGDLCQFVAVQEIPNFGLHGYYAISIEPLSKWSHANTNTAKKATMKPKHYADCFKNSCKLAESTYCSKKNNESGPSSPPPSSSHVSQQQQPGISGQRSQAPVNSENMDPSENTGQQNECEKVPGSKTQFVPLPPIPFQTFRKEIAGFESRPTWGRSRYIERLIDESPHLAADLDVSQADAMLHVMSDKIFKKADNYRPCAISDTRRRVERMMDLPPCAVDPGEIKPNPGPFYTCYPKKEKVIETHPDVCLSESDFYPCGKRSGLSLRGGSDSGSCCNTRNEKRRSRPFSDRRGNDMNSSRYYIPEFSRPQQIIDASQNGSIFDDTDDTLDVDTSIHRTTTAGKYIDPEKSGNFKWLEDTEQITVSDPTSDSRTQMRPFSSDTMTNEFYNLDTEGCSEFNEEPPINEQLHPEKLMPQVARRLQSSKQYHSRRTCPSLSQQPPSCSLNTRSYAQGGKDDVEPSMAVVRRRFAKSREATGRNPEIQEKSYRWKEIIDQTAPSRDQSSRSKGGQKISHLDLEYLDYVEAMKTDRGYCCDDDDDDEDDEIEEPRYYRRATGQILDADMEKYTKKLLRPPKATPSPGRVTMPLSKQNRRRQNTEAKPVREPSDSNIYADESK